MSALSIFHHPLPICRLRWVFVVVLGILVPWPGTEPVSPALEGGFLTTGLPDKSQTSPLYTATRSLGTEGYVLLREALLPPWVAGKLFTLCFTFVVSELSRPLRVKICEKHSLLKTSFGEGNGNPLQYSSLLWTEETGGLLSIRSHRVRHDWSDLACMHAKTSFTPHALSLVSVPGSVQGHRWEEITNQASKEPWINSSIMWLKWNVSLYGQPLLLDQGWGDQGTRNIFLEEGNLEGNLRFARIQPVDKGRWLPSALGRGQERPTCPGQVRVVVWGWAGWMGIGPGECRSERWARACRQPWIRLWQGVWGGGDQWDFNKGSVTLWGEEREEGDRAGWVYILPVGPLEAATLIWARSNEALTMQLITAQSSEDRRTLSQVRKEEMSKPSSGFLFLYHLACQVSSQAVLPWSQHLPGLVNKPFFFI